MAIIILMLKQKIIYILNVYFCLIAGDKVSSIRVPRVVNQLVDFGKDYARENPVTALILLALCLTSSAPVLIFLVFAVLTILVTFLGFLFVEGKEKRGK